MIRANLQILATLALTACASPTNGLKLPPNLPPTASVTAWAEVQARGFSSSPIRWANGQGRMKVVRDEFRGHDVLQVGYPRGAVGAEDGGAQWGARLTQPRERAKVSYWVRFAPGFKFALGGKLPGLIGGRESGLPVAGGIRPTGENGWSARLMWLEAGQLVQYVYHMDQKGKYGDQIPWLASGKAALLKPGSWHHLESEITLNAPAKADGRIRSWFDGQLVLDRGDFRFRSVPTIQIDTLFFSTFFGGETPDWVPLRDEWVRFDGFEVR